MVIPIAATIRSSALLSELYAHCCCRDGIWQDGIGHDSGATPAEKTLVLACCDPAAGLLAAEYARASGFRLLVIERGGGAALELLKRGLVHLAGVHRSTSDHPSRNAETARAQLGEGYRLIRIARWQEGLALPAGNRPHALSDIVRQCRRWALREPGSAARECLDELLAGQNASGKPVHSHLAVAEAVRAGWAGAGVCVQLTAQDAGAEFRACADRDVGYLLLRFDRTRRAHTGADSPASQPIASQVNQ